MCYIMYVCFLWGGGGSVSVFFTCSRKVMNGVTSRVDDARVELNADPAVLPPSGASLCLVASPRSGTDLALGT